MANTWFTAWGSECDQGHVSRQGLAHHGGYPPLKDHIPDTDTVDISPNTVANHVKKVLSKLGVAARHQVGKSLATREATE